MKLPRTYVRLWILVGCLGYSVIGNAQTDYLRKKTVSRIIDIPLRVDTVRYHLAAANDDTLLIKMITTAVMSGKLVAYDTGIDFTNTLTPSKLKERMIDTHQDTTTVWDPVGKKVVHSISSRDITDNLHKFKVFEEWGFDSHTGKTDVQIKGIAPLAEVYSKDWSVKSLQPMFFLRYQDIRGLIARYDRLHPTKTFASLIWDDYFYSDVKPKAQN